MKKFTRTILATALLSTAAVSAAADERDGAMMAKQGATFMGTAVAGAAVAGPFGFIGGALIGAYFAENIEAAEREEQTVAQLAITNRELREVEAQLGEARYTISVQQSHLETSMYALQDALSVDLLFSFNDAELSERDLSRIGRVARILQEYPELSMTIHGFADHRGDDDYNHELSAKRAERVAQAFIESGIAADRISTEARGEVATAADVDQRELAQSRRVSVAIELNDVSVAQN
ncbi:MAG: OmpA family protein [Gammaproteobacteria bacterium]|nr:OmpA family protein [Gammaproteobacteria bacterium]